MAYASGCPAACPCAVWTPYKSALGKTSDLKFPTAGCLETERRVGVWVGPAESFAAASLAGPRLPAISRHALWLMLQLGHDPLFHVPSLVLDVRRPEERLLYGAIRGTINIQGRHARAGWLGFVALGR